MLHPPLRPALISALHLDVHSLTPQVLFHWNRETLTTEISPGKVVRRVREVSGKGKVATLHNVKAYGGREGGGYTHS
jgi:hypothetical protein